MMGRRGGAGAAWGVVALASGGAVASAVGGSAVGHPVAGLAVAGAVLVAPWLLAALLVTAASVVAVRGRHANGSNVDNSVEILDAIRKLLDSLMGRG
jgi:hypothetical protein